MLAADAIDGQTYNLLGKGARPQYNGAVCNGWNHTHEWLLFVVYSERGARKVVMMMPTEEIEKSKAFN